MAHPTLTDEQVTAAVRDRYAAAAHVSLAAAGCDCGPGCCADTSHADRAAETAAAGGCCSSSCCGSEGATADPITGNLYDPAEAPTQGALQASLGCGNPTALVDLQPGQDVLDLGSGGGLDVLLSARRVAPGGIAYGVDMTDEMLQLAERNKAEAGIDNATFVKGSIEHLPLSDSTVDVVISNCVINLSPDKDAVLAEAHRVLRPGGRFAVSDIVLLRALEPHWAALVGLWTGCIAGALLDTDYLAKLTAAGFTDPNIQITRRYTPDDLAELANQLATEHLPAGSTPADAVDALQDAFAAAFIRATKPT